MNWLPVVERELLVTARRKGTAWERVAFAGVALIVFAFLLAFSNLPPRRLGQELFTILSLLLFMSCAVAGVRYTSDCLSEERRNGTLPLLFLTNLSGLGIVLGKMASRTLAPVYNLVAALPVLSMCLLLGGVTAGQIWAVSLALVGTTFISLAAGLWVSSGGLGEKNVLVTTVVLLLVMTLLPPALWELWRGLGRIGLTYPPPAWILWPSPAYLSYVAKRGFTLEFLNSVGVVSALTLVLLTSAAWRLHRNFADPGESTRRKRGEASSLSLQPRRWFRHNHNPVLWLLTRGERCRRAALILTAVALVLGILGRIVFEQNLNPHMALVMFSSYGLHSLYRLLLAAEACRQLNGDRRSGALELLLTTPLPPILLVQGQLQVLRHFWGPAIAGLVLLNLAWMSHGTFMREMAILLPCSLAVLFLDSYALAWRGMVHALQGRNYPQTVLRTWAEVMLPPLCFFGLSVLAIMTQGGGVSEREIKALIVVWTILACGYDLFLVDRAQSLLKNLRGLAASERLGVT